MLPNTSCIAFGVVPSLCSSTISPRSSNTQYQLERSPRSKPIVSFCPEKFFLLCPYSANLLHCRSPFYLCFEHVDNLGAYRIPPETGLLIPSAYKVMPWTCFTRGRKAGTPAGQIPTAGPDRGHRFPRC
jgi:hypothetical protein